MTSDHRVAGSSLPGACLSIKYLCIKTAVSHGNAWTLLGHFRSINSEGSKEDSRPFRASVYERLWGPSKRPGVTVGPKCIGKYPQHDDDAANGAVLFGVMTLFLAAFVIDVYKK